MAGVRGNALLWFKSYLQNRTQYEEIGNIKSDRIKIDVGVPQGSILGPLLFLVFINDFTANTLHGIPTLFADDTNIFYFGDSKEEIVLKMKSDLEIIKKWVDLNMLFINLSKTKYIFFSKPSNKIESDFVLEYTDTVIGRVSYVKFLGFYLDENLLWEVHINQVVKKLSPFVRMLCRLNSVLSDKAKKCIYYGLIQSHLVYMNVIWCNASSVVLGPVNILQNRAIKNLYNLNHRTHTSDVYSSSCLLNFSKLSFLSAAYFGFATIKGYWLRLTRFVLNTEYHQYPTRMTKRIHYRRFVSTKYGLKGVYNKICHDYNKLPENMLDSSSLCMFKKRLKKMASK